MIIQSVRSQVWLIKPVLSVRDSFNIEAYPVLHLRPLAQYYSRIYPISLPYPIPLGVHGVPGGYVPTGIREQFNCRRGHSPSVAWGFAASNRSVSNLSNVSDVSASEESNKHHYGRITTEGWCLRIKPNSPKGTPKRTHAVDQPGSFS
jgi:hypothetical protein